MLLKSRAQHIRWPVNAAINVSQSISRSLHICNTFFNLIGRFIVHAPFDNVIFSHNGIRNLCCCSQVCAMLLKTSFQCFWGREASPENFVFYYKYIKGLWVFRITWFSTRYLSMDSLLCRRLFYDIKLALCVNVNRRRTDSTVKF